MITVNLTEEQVKALLKLIDNRLGALDALGEDSESEAYSADIELQTSEMEELGYTLDMALEMNE